MEKKFGLRIRQERLRLGWTQEQTAEVIGVSERQYRRYENDESTMSVEYMVVLANKGFDINYILVGVTSYDIAVRGGMNKMPNDLFLETMREMIAALDEENIIDSREKFGKVLIKFANYYYGHIKERDVRNVEWINFFTMLYEEQRELVKQSIKYRNERN